MTESHQQNKEDKRDRGDGLSPQVQRVLRRGLMRPTTDDWRPSHTADGRGQHSHNQADGYVQVRFGGPVRMMSGEDLWSVFVSGDGQLAMWRMFDDEHAARREAVTLPPVITRAALEARGYVYR